MASASSSGIRVVRVTYTEFNQSRFETAVIVCPQSTAFPLPAALGVLALALVLGWLVNRVLVREMKHPLSIEPYGLPTR